MPKEIYQRPSATGFRFAALLGVVFVSALPVFCQSDRSIEGRVRTIDGGPLPADVTVRLEEAEGVVVGVHQHFVGTDGKFKFDDLHSNSYRIVVTAKGFQTVTMDVDMRYLASRYPSIYLVPVVKKKEASSPFSTPTATDLAAPKKARKEYEKGTASLRDGDVRAARGHLEKAVADDPCYARAQTALGVAESLQRELAAAESAFNQAIKCDGGYLEAYIQLAILLNAQAKYEASQTALQAGLRRFPDEWQLYYQLGMAQGAVGAYAKAEESYLKAESIHPAVPPEFHLRLANACLNRKEYDKAYAEMQAYLSAEPNGRAAEQAKRIMRQMEASGVLSKQQQTVDQQRP